MLSEVPGLKMAMNRSLKIESSRSLRKPPSDLGS